MMCPPGGGRIRPDSGSVEASPRLTRPRSCSTIDCRMAGIKKDRTMEVPARVSVFGVAVFMVLTGCGDTHIDYCSRGLAYAKRGEFDRAIASYDKAIERDPWNAEAYASRGYVYYAKGEYDRAIANYSRAIDLDPAYTRVYVNRGDAYSMKAEYDRAVSDYTKALELNPRLAKVYDARGLARAAQGDFDRAVSNFTVAIGLELLEPRFYLHRASAYRNKGLYEQAWQDVRQAQKLGLQAEPDFLKRLREDSDGAP